jgi:hypothetical protein
MPNGEPNPCIQMIHLSIPEHGWIDITFGDEPESYTVVASDVPNDCLRDLAAATSLLLDGSTDETVEFSLEPDFANCHLHRGFDSVVVTVKDPFQVTVFQGTFPLRAFAQKLRDELLRIEPCYSDGTSWTQPFPHDEVAQLPR